MWLAHFVIQAITQEPSLEASSALQSTQRCSMHPSRLVRQDIEKIYRLLCQRRY